MRDSVLSALSASMELGIPAVLGALCWRRPHLRPKLLVLLGSVTPAVVVYVGITAIYLMPSGDLGNRWSFGAVWLMSLPAYVSALIAGFAFSLWNRPRSYFLRYLIGVLAAPIGYGTLILLFRVVMDPN